MKLFNKISIRQFYNHTWNRVFNEIVNIYEIQRVVPNWEYYRLGPFVFNGLGKLRGYYRKSNLFFYRPLVSTKINNTIGCADDCLSLYNEYKLLKMIRKFNETRTM